MYFSKALQSVITINKPEYYFYLNNNFVNVIFMHECYKYLIIFQAGLQYFIATT